MTRWTSVIQYSVREVESTLDEMVLAEQDEFEEVGDLYRWKKHYRFRTRPGP
jgi:hypothetical protein